MAILDQFKLDGKAAIVTGAGRGLGQGLAFGLAVANQDQLRPATSALDHLTAMAPGRNHSPSNSGFITRPVNSLGWK